MTPSLLDHPLITRRYFFPFPCRFPDPCRVEREGAVLGCRHFRVDPAALTIVHFHGNGETVADYLDDFAAAVAALGCNLFLAEYRGYGMSTGVPELGRMLGDVPAVIAATGQPPERLVLFGRSVGSLFALHGVAAVPGIAGLIVESGIADPLERLLMRVSPGELGVTPAAFAAAVAAELDQRRKLFLFNGRTLVLHARNDDLVDVSHGERLYQWAGEPKRLHVFPRGDHNNIMAVNWDEYFRIVGEFLAGSRVPM